MIELIQIITTIIALLVFDIMKKLYRRFTYPKIFKIYEKFLASGISSRYQDDNIHKAYKIKNKRALENTLPKAIVSIFFKDAYRPIKGTRGGIPFKKENWLTPNWWFRGGFTEQDLSYLFEIIDEKAKNAYSEQYNDFKNQMSY